MKWYQIEIVIKYLIWQMMIIVKPCKELIKSHDNLHNLNNTINHIMTKNNGLSKKSGE